MFLQVFLHSSGHGQSQVARTQFDTRKGSVAQLLQTRKGSAGTAGRAGRHSLSPGQGRKMLFYWISKNSG